MERQYTHKRKSRKNDSESEQNDDEEIKMENNQTNEKVKERLKKKILEWLDYDDKIKELNNKSKKIKNAKKREEEIIMKMITKLGMDGAKIDVKDKNNLKSRVYKYKSVTKGPINAEIIKRTLMEGMINEKKADHFVKKKIENTRPINENYYLKRTKGEK